jgi:subtilisin family serine protease
MIAVTAVDNDGSLPEFSNFGVNHVHVAAPGVDIYSTLKNEAYGLDSGTSMATPHVTGVAALALSANPGLSMKELRQKVVSSVTPLASLRGKIASGGVIDAMKAVTP